MIGGAASVDLVSRHFVGRARGRREPGRVAARIVCHRQLIDFTIVTTNRIRDRRPDVSDAPRTIGRVATKVERRPRAS